MIAQGGDGGTTDIGFQCLSGMFERNDDVLYICYDNEGYMNTGVQRSSATPPAARTATTPALGPEPGNVFGTGKFVPKIAMAHDIPYVATATVADLRDLERKVIKAMSIQGARYIQISVPCPLGWGAASFDTIKLARLAVECGLYPIFEANTARHQRAQTAAAGSGAGLSALQKRYAHLFRGGVDDPRVAQHAGDLRRAYRGIWTARRSRRSLTDSLMDHDFAITLDVGTSLANHTGSWRTFRPDICRSAAALQRRLPGGRGHSGLAGFCRSRRL